MVTHVTIYHERFFKHDRYAVVGHTAHKPFPRLTYRGLRNLGKQVFAIDPSAEEIEGDRAYPSFEALPEKVDAAVLELPRDETAGWVKQVAEAGVERVWLHMKSDSPDAVAVARESGLELHRGTCAVMYVSRGVSYHHIHRWANKLAGRY